MRTSKLLMVAIVMASFGCEPGTDLVSIPSLSRDAEELTAASAVSSAGVAPRLAVVETIPVGSFPAPLALANSDATLYVVNQNPFRSPRRPSISVIETRTHTVAPNPIVLNAGVAEQMAVTPDGRTAYVAVSRRVEVVDLLNGVVKDPVQAGFMADVSDIALDLVRNRGYVTDRTADLVVEFDMSTSQWTDTFRVGPGNVSQPYGIAITPDRSRLYMANRATATMSVIEIADRSRTTINLSIGPSLNVTQVAISPDGLRAYVTFGTSNEVSVIDTDPTSATFNQELGTLRTCGGNLADVTVSEDGELVLVTATAPTDALLVLDATAISAGCDRSVLATVPVAAAGGVAFRGTRDVLAYVTSVQDDGSVSVIGAERQERLVPELALKTPLPAGRSWLLTVEAITGRSFDGDANEFHVGNFALDLLNCADPGCEDRGAGTTPVLAAAAGSVVSVCVAFECRGTRYEELGIRGNLVEVAHANGYSTFYEHLHDDPTIRALQIGDEVVAGTALGVVGNSGAGGPHLHFAVRYQGLRGEDWRVQSRQVFNGLRRSIVLEGKALANWKVRPCARRVVDTSRCAFVPSTNGDHIR